MLVALPPNPNALGCGRKPTSIIAVMWCCVAQITATMLFSGMLWLPTLPEFLIAAVSTLIEKHTRTGAVRICLFAMTVTVSETLCRVATP
jgi:hypothetical protein